MRFNLSSTPYMPKYSFPVCDISPYKIFLCDISPHSFLVCDSCSDIVFCIRYLHRHRYCVWDICPYIVFLPVISAQTSGLTEMYQVNAKMNSQLYIDRRDTHCMATLYNTATRRTVQENTILFASLCTFLIFVTNHVCVLQGSTALT